MAASRPLALVTGASSGLGLYFALGLARRGHDLVITGRDAARLADTAAQARALGAAVEEVTVDLGAPEGVGQLVDRLAGRTLEVLVNNAGFGDSGPVAQAQPRALAGMVELNVLALVNLTRAFLPAMTAAGKGRILLVASTAAFQPIPGMAVYGATKSFVLSFGAALAVELRGTGVTVTTLCPGPTHTRFADRAAVGSSPVFKLAMAADTVAEIGLKALFRGRPVRVAGALNAALAFSSRLAPRILLASAAGRLMGSAGK